MKIIAHLANNNSIILIGPGKRFEIHSGHEKYNEVLEAMRETDQVRLETLVTEIEALSNHRKITYTASNSTLTIMIDGEEPLMIGKFDIRFNRVKEALEAKEWHRVEELIKPENALEGTGFEMKDKVIYFDGDALPETISKRLVDLILRGMPLSPIMNLWKKLRLNPSFNTRKQLFLFLEANNIPLSEDGNFIAYKKVRSDFKDIHSNTFDNSVGQVVKMSRENVDDNPNNTCSSGLHVCSYEYLAHFGSSEGGDKIVLCSVDPSHVIAVPVDYKFTKLRTSEYKVIELLETAAPMNKPVYESDESYDDDLSTDSEDFELTRGYSEDQRDEVISLYNEYGHRYSGESLLNRISEALEDNNENEIDNETIEQILIDEGHSDF